MTGKEKIDFVHSLCDNVKIEICSKIDSGRIPDNWDGTELRELLKDNFKKESIFRDKREKRYQDYKNTVLVNNI